MDLQMRTSTLMANHADAWKSPQPFYMEDWTHRAK
jgi:hypothetical protein